MDSMVWLLAAWLPIAGVVLALCLSPDEEESEPGGGCQAAVVESPLR